jgi:hypothetical protein
MKTAVAAQTILIVCESNKEEDGHHDFYWCLMLALSQIFAFILAQVLALGQSEHRNF